MAYDGPELALFNKGETLDPLVSKYQEMIKQSDQLIIVCPIWWNDVPAILKGFINKVFKKNFAYKMGKYGVVGLLNHIEKVTMITTASSPKWYIRFFVENGILGPVKTTFKQIGAMQFDWIYFGFIDKSDQVKREKILESLKEI